MLMKGALAMKRFQTVKRCGIVGAVLVWALLLLPFFWGAAASHPATDDFTFAAYTHPTWLQTGSLLHVLKDALSYALRTWRDWQGTVTGVILMALNPAVFSIRLYGLHAVALLALDLVAVFVFTEHMFGTRLGLPAGFRFHLCLILSLIQLLFLPDIVEGIYWFNGAWFYMGAQAVALIALVLCDRLAVSRAATWKRAAMAVICAAVLFALGMDNYITAMMTAAALLMMALQRAWAWHAAPDRACIGVITHNGKEHAVSGVRTFDAPTERARQRRATIRTALLLVPIGAGLLLSVIAPGNAVRMATDGAHQSGLSWLFLTMIWTLRDAALYFVRFFLKTPLLMVLLLLTPALCAALPRNLPERRWRVPPVWATLLGLYLILCAMIIPHMYSSGYAGSGRVVNMYHSYVVLASPIALALVLMRLSASRQAALAGKRALAVCSTLAAVALVIWCLGGQQNHYIQLVSDQLDGTQDAYIAQFQREYALCEAAGPEDDVLLPAWTAQTLTGKPTVYEDPAVWTNESMAHYFGVASVRSVQEDETAVTP